MNFKSMMKTVILGATALSFIACAEQERVAELADGPYVPLTEVELAERGLPSTNFGNTKMEGLSMSEDSKSLESTLLMISDDAKKATMTRITVDASELAQGSEQMFSLEISADRIGDKLDIFSTGIVDLKTMSQFSDISTYFAKKAEAKAKKEAAAKAKKEGKEVEKEEKAEVKKVKVEDIPVENRVKYTMEITNIDPWIIAVVTTQEDSEKTITSTQYFRLILAPEYEAVTEQLDASLAKKQTVAKKAVQTENCEKDCEEVDTETVDEEEGKGKEVVAPATVGPVE